MSDEARDYSQRWCDLLSYGSSVFSEKLLTSGIALIVSSDGRKISVIDDNNSNSPYEYYDEQEQYVQVDLRFLRRNAGRGAPLDCPACGQAYIFSFHLQSKDLPDGDITFDDGGQGQEGAIYITGNRHFFNCSCGVLFFFNDKYEYVTLPFDIEELEPLYQIGMSRTADLLVRYSLISNGHSLIEDIGAVARMPYETSLTDNPSRRFYWTIPPCFSSECDGRRERVYDVRIWRRRFYVLDCDRFAESTWRHYEHRGETVIRHHKFKGNNLLSVFASLDELSGSEKLLESLLYDDGNQPSPSGNGPAEGRSFGGRPVKFAPDEQQVKSFAPEYDKAKALLDSVLQVRRLKQFGRYIEGTRKAILKNLFPDMPNTLTDYIAKQKAAALEDSAYGNASEAALHIAAWRVKIPIGAWQSSQLYELLKVSKNNQPPDLSEQSE